MVVYIDVDRVIINGENITGAMLMMMTAAEAGCDGDDVVDWTGR